MSQLSQDRQAHNGTGSLYGMRRTEDFVNLIFGKAILFFTG